MPDEKSPAIDDLLTQISGKDRKTEIAAGRCSMCADLDMNFRDESTRRGA